MRLSLPSLPLLLTLFALTLSVQAALALHAQANSAGIGGEYQLTNQYGKTVSSNDFKGKLQLVYFGYTHCPAECPLATGKVTQAMELLGKDAEQVQPVFITIDPKRDTPEVLKDYAKAFTPTLQALTGPKEAIDRTAKAFKVYAHIEEQDAGHMHKSDTNAHAHGKYELSHSDIIYLMGRDGVFLDHFSADSTPQQIAARVQQALTEK